MEGHTISKSERRNNILIIGGHEYLKRNDRPGKNGEIHWRCRYFKKYKCKAKAVTLNDQVIEQDQEHSHQGDRVRAVANDVAAKVRTLASTSGLSTRNVLGKGSL